MSDSELELVKVAPLTFISNPSQSTTFISHSDPTLVLLLGWANATPALLKRYIKEYRKLFPFTPTILLLTPSSTFYAPRSTIQKALQPCSSLISSLSPNPAASRLLIHSFSNGGALSLKELDVLSHRNDGVGLEKMTKALIVDSAPSTDTSFSRTIKAGSLPLEGSWVKWPAIVGMVSITAFLKVLAATTPYEIPNIPLAPYLLAHFSLTPQLFIYSLSDIMVPSENVQTHIENLRKVGGSKVKVEEYDGTDHCAHTRGRENAERYWRSVKEIWREGNSGEAEGERLKKEGVKAKL